MTRLSTYTIAAIATLTLAMVACSSGSEGAVGGAADAVEGRQVHVEGAYNVRAVGLEDAQVSGLKKALLD